MMSSSFIEKNRWVLSVPFFYAYFSRMKGIRGFGFNAATLWVPGIIIVTSLMRQTHENVLSSAFQYGLGYLVFICIYELGYLMNDTWGLRNDSTPRRRIDVDLSKTFIAAFIGVRLLVVILIASLLGYLLEGWFIAIVMALVATILLHNLLVLEEFKLISFMQMSLLRFCTPIFIACGGQVPSALFIGALMLFTFPRFLTYQDSKNRLNLPERKNPFFGLGNVLASAPLIGLLAYLRPDLGIQFVWGYFLLLWSLGFIWLKWTSSEKQPVE